MQRFHVPQFIEVEDKIFGPLTLKQFIYVLGGGAIAFIMWIALPRVIAIIGIIPVAALSLGFAFYKVNGQPLLQVLANMFQYYIHHRLYLWRKESPKKGAKKELAHPDAQEMFLAPRAQSGRLNNLSWSLDIHENLSSRERILEKNKTEMNIGEKRN